MRVLFDLGHPAHYHLVKNLAKKLNKNGHEIYFSIQKKDVLEDLVKETSYNYINILPNGRKSSKFGLVKSLIQRFINILFYSIKIKPNFLIGTSHEISYIGKLLNIPSFNLNEDDANVVFLYSILAYPFATEILTPISCNNGRWDKKSIKYNSFHELAYLHPKYFSPDIDILEKYNITRPYFIIRFSKLNAHHDYGINGINDLMALNIINKLKGVGNVYLSSERELDMRLEQYKLSIDPKDIHHLLFSTNLLISDSQTMTAEAAVLGTPSLRFNDFVGKLGYLEELEHMYDLTYGIKTSEPEKLLQKIDELLEIPNLKEEWQKRRIKMLSEKIDITAFMVWFIENYPNSVKIMKKNPDYQYNFK